MQSIVSTILILIGVAILIGLRKYTSWDKSKEIIAILLGQIGLLLIDLGLVYYIYLFISL